MTPELRTEELRQVLLRGAAAGTVPAPHPETFPGLAELLQADFGDPGQLAWAADLRRVMSNEFGDDALAQLTADTGNPDDDLDDRLRAVIGCGTDDLEALWVASLAARDRPIGLRELIRWLRPWLRGSGRMIAIGSVSTVYLALFSIILPLGYKMIIDEGIASGDRSRLVAIFLVLLGLFLLNTLATVGRDFSGARLSAQVQLRLRSAMFDRMLDVDEDFYSYRSSGDLASRFASDVDRLENVISRFIPGIVTMVISLVGSALVILRLDVRLAILTVILIPLVLVGPLLFGPPTGRAAEQEMTATGKLSEFVVEHLRMRSVVRAFDRRTESAGAFESASNTLALAGVRTRMYGSLIGASIEISMTLLQLAGFGLGAFLVMSGDIELGALIAFQGLVGNVAAPVLGFSEMMESSRHAGGVVRRLDEILDATTPPDNGTDITGVDSVALDHVSFTYATGRGIDDIDLDLRRGQTVAIVGASGSGKSTLMSLLLGDLTPTAGSILVDQRPLSQVRPASWRSHLGVVFQEPLLFEGTVADNIRVGRADATAAEIADAAARAGLVGDAAVPLDATISLGGGGLSGGQRQRVCIARALVRSPQVLLFDEPTSALDHESAAAVTATLQSLTGGAMIVIVTHQLGLAQIADRIVVMSAGRIVESGSYDDLVAAGGHFARLHELGGGALGRPRHVDGLAELLADDNVAVTTRRLADGDIVFHEGDPADMAYVVRSGAATVSMASDGGELELGLMGRGELIGELGVLSDGVRSATVRAVGDTVLVEIPPDELRELIAAPANAADIGSQVVTRLLRDRQTALARYARGGRTP